MERSQTRLFSTIVGSHMWNMNTPESDLDIMTIYQIPTIDILSGKPYPSTLPQEQEKNNDISFWEIGHLIHQLIKGNINAIWAVTSPYIQDDSLELKTLRKITTDNLSSRTFHSCYGMSLSQLKDAEKRQLGIKAWRTSYRTSQFGIKLLTTGKLVFDPAPTTITEDMVKQSLYDLEQIYTNKQYVLPENVDPTPFQEYLLYLRLTDLESSKRATIKEEKRNKDIMFEKC